MEQVNIFLLYSPSIFAQARDLFGALKKLFTCREESRSAGLRTASAAT